MALRSGDMGRQAFVASQVQFYGAVCFFHQPMAALGARLPTAEQRAPVLRNVWEELGEGELSERHAVTFERLLARLGAAPGPVGVEVEAFNTLLLGACVSEDPLLGAATLGMIERLFVDVSACIGRTIVSRRWLEASQVVHYAVHEALDVRHSADFFDVLRPGWPAQQAPIERGLRLGAYAFDQLYRGLHRRVMG